MSDESIAADPADEIERRGRHLKERLTPLAFRLDALDGKPGFSGYASTHWHVDSYGTAFAPGAWKRSIRDYGERGVPVLWQHWPDMPVGRSTTLKDDRTGLAVDARVSDATQLGNETIALARDGIVGGLSVGFRTLESRSATDDDPLILDFAPEPLKAKAARSEIQIIERAKLYEFSIVTFPANEAAAITAMRADIQIDALQMALDDLGANRLDDDRRSLIERIALAWQRRLDGARSAPPAATAPHVPIALLTEELAYLLSA